VSDEDWVYNYFNYFTEIEEHFQRARATGLFLLSPLDWALVGMLDFTGCNAGTNLAGCALSSGSPYKDAGTDGMDIGANVAAVVAALAPIVW